MCWLFLFVALPFGVASGEMLSQKFTIKSHRTISNECVLDTISNVRDSFECTRLCMNHTMCSEFHLEAGICRLLNCSMAGGSSQVYANSQYHYICAPMNKSQSVAACETLGRNLYNPFWLELRDLMKNANYGDCPGNLWIATRNFLGAGDVLQLMRDNNSEIVLSEDALYVFISLPGGADQHVTLRADPMEQGLLGKNPSFVADGAVCTGDAFSLSDLYIVCPQDPADVTTLFTYSGAVTACQDIDRQLFDPTLPQLLYLAKYIRNWQDDDASCQLQHMRVATKAIMNDGKLQLVRGRSGEILTSDASLYSPNFSTNPGTRHVEVYSWIDRAVEETLQDIEDDARAHGVVCL